MPSYDKPPRVTDILKNLSREQRRMAANRRVENAQITQGGITITDPEGNVVGKIGELDDGSTGIATASGNLDTVIEQTNADVQAAQDAADDAKTTSENAAAVAADANSAASAALSAANDKNKSTFSTDEPGDTANTAGDLWFQRDANGVILSQWEGMGGTSWTQRQLRSEVIASLDAGKITTGTLDADRIGTNTITADKINGDSFFGNTFTGGTFTGATIRTSATFPRLELTSTAFNGYGEAGATWMKFNETGLRSYFAGGGVAQHMTGGGGDATGGLWTYRENGTVASYIGSAGLWHDREDGSTASSINGNGIRTFRPDGTRGATLNENGIEVRHADGTTPAIFVGRPQGGDVAGLWMYRTNGVVSAILNPTSISLRKPDGTGAVAITSGNPYPHNRFFAPETISFSAEGVNNQIVLQSGGIILSNYLYGNHFRTTTQAANLHRSPVDAQIFLVSSMGYNKLDQEVIDLEAAEAVLDLVPKTWRDRSEVADNPDTTNRVPGFVAEEVKAVSEERGGVLDPLVSLNESNGTAVIGINYDRIPAYLIPLIRDLRDRVETLEAQLAAHAA